MTRNEIDRTLRNLMKTSSREKKDWDHLPESTPIASLGFDSLSILDLVYDLQQTFHLEFEAEDLLGIKTVADLLDWLTARTASI
jgi:acyl carrier protein